MSRRANEMVERQLIARGIADARVLDAMRRIPRQAFVARDLRAEAYADSPLPIGEGQTISQPYVVALMLEALQLRASDRVLDVGAGSGYTAAVLSLIVAEVYAIERHCRLADAARARLARLGRSNVELRCGDGSTGWPDAAPFDAILVGAGGPDVPTALRDQLAPGGRLVIPVERPGRFQRLVKLTRTGAGDCAEEDLGAVSFVPLIGAQGWPDREADGHGAAAAEPASRGP